MSNSNWDLYWEDESKLEYWKKPAKSVIELIEKCDPNEQTKVLDLGCGIGRHAIAFAQAGFDVTAFDNSEKAMKKLNQKVEGHNLNIYTIVGNYLEPVFEKDSFDIIISYNVIYHGFKEDLKKAINLCKNYLRVGGLLFFTCPTRDDGKYGSGKEVAPHTYESLNSVHPGDIHYFSDKKDIHEFIEGFKLVSLKRNEHYWENNGVKQFSSYWEVLVKKKNRCTVA